MADEIKNNRVTTIQFYEALLKQKDELKEMREDNRKTERRILTRIDGVSEKFATKEDVDNLRKRIRNSDVVLSIGVVLATTIGAVFGRK